MPMPASASRPSRLVDSDHPDVVAFARAATADVAGASATAAALFEAVRDHIRYDPYRLALHPDRMRASHVVGGDPTWCVPKATLLAACCRAVGLPALVGFADVRNHLSSDRLTELMGTDEFIWHGYTAIEVDGVVRKASPAFNAELCERFGVEPLTFDGTADALLHAHDGQGRRYMEYLRDRGLHADVPLDDLARDLRATYPRLLEATDDGRTRDRAFS